MLGAVGTKEPVYQWSEQTLTRQLQWSVRVTVGLPKTETLSSVVEEVEESEKLLCIEHLN